MSNTILPRPTAASRAVRALHTTLTYVFLRHIFFVEIAIFSLGLLVGIALVTDIWQQPVSLNDFSARTSELNVDGLNELELWIEQRQQELETPLQLQPREYFVR